MQKNERKPKPVPPAVMAMGKINFTGNVTPRIWNKRLVLNDKRGTRAHLVAIAVLSEICWWYRPNEESKVSEGVYEVQKFAADALQKSYEDLGNEIGLTKEQCRDACHWLQKYGLIQLDFRTVVVRGVKMNNVLYIHPNVPRIADLTDKYSDFTLENNPYPLQSREGLSTSNQIAYPDQTGHLSTLNSIPIDFEVETNTENTHRTLKENNTDTNTTLRESANADSTGEEASLGEDNPIQTSLPLIAGSVKPEDQESELEVIGEKEKFIGAAPPETSSEVVKPLKYGLSPSHVATKKVDGDRVYGSIKDLDRFMAAYTQYTKEAKAMGVSGSNRKVAAYLWYERIERYGKESDLEFAISEYFAWVKSAGAKGCFYFQNFLGAKVEADEEAPWQGFYERALAKKQALEARQSSFSQRTPLQKMEAVQIRPVETSSSLVSKSQAEEGYSEERATSRTIVMQKVLYRVPFANITFYDTDSEATLKSKLIIWRDNERRRTGNKTWEPPDLSDKGISVKIPVKR